MKVNVGHSSPNKLGLWWADAVTWRDLRYLIKVTHHDLSPPREFASRTRTHISKLAAVFNIRLVSVEVRLSLVWDKY